MPRPKRIDPPVRKEVSLPQSVVAAIDLELWSELEDCVPQGKWSSLVEELLREWLGERKVS